PLRLSTIGPDSGRWLEARNLEKSLVCDDPVGHSLTEQMSMARPRPVRGSATPTAVTYVGRDGLPAATSAPRSRRAVSANAEPVAEFAGRGVADTHFDQVALYPLPERLTLVP